jgi:hypothetical protein
LKYLIIDFDEDLNTEINLYELYKNNFSSLLCVILNNTYYHETYLEEKNIKLLKTIYSFKRNKNIMPVIQQLLHKEPLLKNANKL